MFIYWALEAVAVVVAADVYIALENCNQRLPNKYKTIWHR